MEKGDAMAVRSTRLGNTSVATAGAGATTVIFTTPTDRTAIVKDVRVAVTAATAFPVVVDLQVLLSSGVNRLVARQSFPAAGTWAYTGEWWIVLLEGDALRVVQPANCTVQTYVSGASLSGDPS